MDGPPPAGAWTPRDLAGEERRALLERRDGPGLGRFVAQVVAFAALSAATLALGAADHPLAVAAAAIDGLALLTFFASMHEAGHGTAFRTPWLNRAVTWVSAVLMLQSPTFFREFHFEHHRSTSDPHADPEVSGMPGILGEWPSNPVFWFAQAAGQHLLAGKALFTLSCAIAGSRPLYERLYPFVRPSLRRRVTWESRLVVVLLGAAAWIGWQRVPGFAALLLAWPFAHLGLGLFVLPEHTGLPRTGSQLHRTRTTLTHPFLRGAMWNMPWHAEHHAWPAVPFHALDRLHEKMRGDLEHVSPGYLAFHAEALRRSLGLR